jgi:hypothetical protein
LAFHLERSVIERSVIERSVIERSVIERSVVERSVVEVLTGAGRRVNGLPTGVVTVKAMLLHQVHRLALLAITGCHKRLLASARQRTDYLVRWLA